MWMWLTRSQLGEKHPQHAPRTDRQICPDPLPYRDLDTQLFPAFPLQRNGFRFTRLHLAAGQFPLPGECIRVAAFGREDGRTCLAPSKRGEAPNLAGF